MTIPQNKLDELLKRIKDAAGSGLISVILYGSAASGNYDPKLSNLNIFCVLRDSSFNIVKAFAPVAAWWVQQKEPPFLLMTLEELRSSTDVFTIELMDMQRHYRVLHGEDVLQGLMIPMHFHRVHVEYELREKLVLLRQRMLLASDNDKKLWDLLLHTVSSFATLFRHAAIALGKDKDIDKRNALQSLASLLSSDLSAVELVLDIRDHKADSKKVDAYDLARRYLAAVEQVTNAVDKKLESGAGNR